MKRPKAARNAQAGHTRAEQEIYSALGTTARINTMFSLQQIFTEMIRREQFLPPSEEPKAAASQSADSGDETEAVSIARAPDSITAASDGEGNAHDHQVVYTDRDLPSLRAPLLVQAGHNAGEQLVYLALWSAGKNRELPDGNRLAARSHHALAATTGRHVRTVERAIAGLIRKGSIEVAVEARADDPTLYRVFSYKMLCRKRVEVAEEDTANGRK